MTSTWLYLENGKYHVNEPVGSDLVALWSANTSALVRRNANPAYVARPFNEPSIFELVILPVTTTLYLIIL